MEQQPDNLTQGGAATVLEYASPRSKTWSVGTLSYTSRGLVLLFFWLLLGDFALYLRDRSIGPVAQLFLKAEGASDTIIAFLLTSLPSAFGMIIGPIISFRSDRLRSKWGRRIPYLLIPTPFAVLAMVGIAFTPQIAGMVHHLAAQRIGLTTCTISVFGFFWTIFGVSASVSMAVFGGLINDVVPVPVMGRFYGMFRAVSLIDAVIFNTFLLPIAERHFFELFIGVAAVFAVGFGLMSLKVKEGQYPPVHDEESPGAGQRGFVHATRTYFRECFTHRYYVLCFVAMTIAQIGFISIWTFLTLYAKQMGIDLAYYGKLNSICAVASLILTYPLGALTDRFHPLRMAIATMFLHMLATAFGGFLIQGPITFAIGLISETLFCSSYLTVTASLAQRLFPRSKFTQFFSASTTMIGLVTLVYAPMLGGLLDITHHNYRLIFVVSSILSAIAVALWMVIYRHFNHYGGTQNYIAPGDFPEDSPPQEPANATAKKS